MSGLNNGMETKESFTSLSLVVKIIDISRYIGILVGLEQGDG
jgi:hypothetical protein